MKYFDFLIILQFAGLFSLGNLFEGQAKPAWPPTLPLFDSLNARCEEIVFYDKDIKLISSYLLKMDSLCAKYHSPQMKSRCLYWKAYSGKGATLSEKVRLLDSAENISLYTKDIYTTQRIRLYKADLLKRQGDYLKAYQIASEAETYFKETGNLMNQAQAEVQNGILLHELGDYGASVDKLKQACLHFEQAGSSTCAIKNRLNLCNALYLSGQKQESLSLLYHLINNPVSRLDTTFLVNVMVSLFRISDYSDNTYVDTALSLALSSRNPELIILTTMSKGADFLTKQQYDSALPYYRRCRHLISKNKSNIIHEFPLLYSFAEIFGQTGQTDSAYLYLRQYVSFKDSILNQEQLMQYRRSEIRSAIEKAENEARIQKERNRLQQKITYAVDSALLLIAAMGFWILGLSRKKERICKQLKEAENRELAIQNERIQQELDAKNRELTSNTLLIAEKNNALNKVLYEVENMLKNKKLPYPEGSSLAFQLKKLLKESNEWTFFKQHFESVHPEFFVRLKEACPQLSENDLRLCALIRIGMSNKEIAQMLGVAPNTIFTTRYRIRKKLNTLIRPLAEEDEVMEEAPEPGATNPGEQSLEDFLRQF